MPAGPESSTEPQRNCWCETNGAPQTWSPPTTWQAGIEVTAPTDAFLVPKLVCDLSINKSGSPELEAQALIHLNAPDPLGQHTVIPLMEK